MTDCSVTASDLARSLGPPSCPKYGTHMHTYCPAAPFLPSFFLSDPASSAVRIFSLNGVSRSAAPPGSSVVREKSPSPRPSIRAAYAEVLARRQREEGGRTATGKKRNLCVSPQFSSLSESVPHLREKRGRHFRYEDENVFL